ncbi:hypothetical protein HYC85_010316 [Camellia sinensis]|uniref:Uncharacterized protein n=1 Tax=Camellia sinensis TaxID=4442 RepID=A0A7J7HHJ5_CAMSI|nr:hypothetical protein HYC85_010316 [Camellia sinensis]
MSDGGLTVLDGTHLRSVDLSLPETNSTVTGSQLLELAESRVSASLFGLSFPQNLKSSALNRFNIIDDVSFRSTELEKDQALSMFKDYMTAIADELKEEPLVVAILDGKTLRLFLEDEDDFAIKFRWCGRMEMSRLVAGAFWELVHHPVRHLQATEAVKHSPMADKITHKVPLEDKQGM